MKATNSAPVLRHGRTYTPVKMDVHASEMYKGDVNTTKWIYDDDDDEDSPAALRS